MSIGNLTKLVKWHETNRSGLNPFSEKTTVAHEQSGRDQMDGVPQKIDQCVIPFRFRSRNKPYPTTLIVGYL